MKLGEEVTRRIGRAVLKAKKNSPHIFFGLGILGIAGGTVLACKATLKLEDALDETKNEFTDIKELKEKSVNDGTEYIHRQYYIDMTQVTGRAIARFGKLYGPAILAWGGGIAAVSGSHIQMTRRNSALTFTLAAVSKAYEEYRTRVREEIGEERELELFRDIRKGVDDEGNKVVTIGDPNRYSPYARFFDECSRYWKRSPEMNKMFIQAQESYMNHQLQQRGHVFLNEVYDSLDMERSREGAIVGWVKNGDGDGFVDFGLFAPDSMRFMNGNECSILLDFNVDGVIFDKI